MTTDGEGPGGRGDTGPSKIDSSKQSRVDSSKAKASQPGRLVRYDAFCRALAEAVAVDEVMAIRDEAAQLAAAARVANNHKAEADAVAIRMRATRRLG